MKKTQNFMEILMVGLVNPDFDRHISKKIQKLKKSRTYKVKAFINILKLRKNVFINISSDFFLSLLALRRSLYIIYDYNEIKAKVLMNFSNLIINLEVFRTITNSREKFVNKDEKMSAK